MARYRVMVGGITKYEREVEASDPLSAIRQVTRRAKITALGGGFYVDGAGNTIKVERVSNGEDDPLISRENRE